MLVLANTSIAHVDKRPLVLPECTTTAEAIVKMASRQHVLFFLLSLLILHIIDLKLHSLGRGLRCRRRRIQHRKQAKVEIRQLEQQPLERLILQKDRHVALHDRQHDRPQPVLTFDAEAVWRALVYGADGLD